MTITTLPNKQELAAHGLALVQETLEKNSTAVIGLTGGSTPAPLYKAMAQSSLDFQSVTFVVTDERYVPLDHGDSNYFMIDSLLFSKINAASIIAFDTASPIQMALQQMSQELDSITMDLLFLGIGPDGHIASLFPHSGALSSTQLVAHTTTDAFAVHDRLTITPTVIAAAKKIVLIASGEQKLDALKTLVRADQPIDAFPARLLSSHKDVTILYSQT